MFSRPMAPRRTRSEMDLSQSQVTGAYPEGEFYTAVGPDGKGVFINDVTQIRPFYDPLCVLCFMVYCDMNVIHLNYG